MRRAFAFFRRSLALLGVGTVVASGCYSSGDGPDPDDRSPYFPVGIALSPSGKYLFLANSNFDLRFNSGTLLAFDAERIRVAAFKCRQELLAWRGGAEKAAAQGKTIAAAPICRDPVPDVDADHPGPNSAKNFAVAGVRIGAFAADLTVVPRLSGPGLDAIPATDGARLLLPVRGDASITVVDFEESGSGVTLRCAPGALPNHFGDKCAPGWRLTGGDGAGSGSRGLTLEGEPFAIASIGPFTQKFTQAEQLVTGITAVIHQSTGDVSLFVNSLHDDHSNNPTAKLAFTLTGLPGGATAIAPLLVAGDPTPRFLVTSRSQNTVSVVQYTPDPTVDRAVLSLTGAVNLTPQFSGYDSRGIVVDPPNDGETRPTRVFVTNRTPASIVVGKVDERGVLSFYENVALPIGPSRIVRAVIGGKTMLLAASFDARSLVLFDPDARRVTNVVLSHRGPYAMAIDSTNKLAFVANFTDSTVQVLDLDPTATESLIYSVGAPNGPRN